MANNHSETERRLWAAADEFRANSELKSSEYATPVLGLIFLRYADHKFTIAEKELKGVLPRSMKSKPRGGVSTPVVMSALPTKPPMILSLPSD